MKNKVEMRTEEVLDLRAMGLSNWVYDVKNKKRYSIQFFDYDYNGEGDQIERDEILKIMQIFPYDCLMYGTKQGIHFISFSLLHGLNITKARALKLAKYLRNQDYWTSQKDLTLRVSEKWKPRRFRGYKVISYRPIFKGVSKFPNQYRISNRHLEFYRKYMNLPDWVYNLYNDCDKRDYKIRIYHYKTRD